MAAYYYDPSNTVDGSRDGSQGHPYLDPSELPTPNRATDAQCEHYFKYGQSINFTECLRSTDDTTVPVVFGAWGDPADGLPVITAYTTVGAEECIEVSVDTSGTEAVLTPASGTNLWRVPKQFFGLYQGNIFGAATDVGNRTGDGKIVPSAPYEWCGAIVNTTRLGVTYGVQYGYGLVYSVGNPVETYGALYKSSFSDSDWYTNGHRAAIWLIAPTGGLTISDIVFDRTARPLACNISGSTNTEPRMMGPVEIAGCRVTNSFRGFVVTGDNADGYPGVGYSKLRVHDNYGENLGNAFFDTSGTAGTILNDARLYHNVINGFSRAQSSGGFYMTNILTTDGSRIMVELNTACNGDAGNYWQTDGHAFYQDVRGKNIEFRRNFTWNCKANYISFLGNEEVYFSNNVGIAPDSPDEDLDNFLVITDGGETEGALVARGNIAVGFRSFLKCAFTATEPIHTITNNISLCGESQRAAIWTNTSDAARILVDGNNFYNHDVGWRNWNDYSNPYSTAPHINNPITSDPSTELARLPVPTDPTVNYALQVRPGARIKSGVVDLRPGTRVAA